MEKPKYNPARAVELTTFLESLSPLELRWMSKQAEEVLETKVEAAEKAWKQASEARWALGLEWTADGSLKSTHSYDDELSIVTPPTEEYAI